MKWAVAALTSGWTLAALAGAIAGMGGRTLYYAEATSYLSNDPTACVNCHIMRDSYDGWQKASHHAVATCNDCHVPEAFVSKYLSKAENGYRHSKGFTFQDFHEPIRIRPKNREALLRNCVRCHRELVAEMIAHADPRVPQPDCVACHSSVGHGPPR